MRKAMLIAAACAALTGCATGMSVFDQLRSSSYATAANVASAGQSYLRQGGSRDGLEVEAKKSVANMLKDPGAAQFRGVVARRYLSGTVVCGEVNGKNSYGAYIGYRRFLASVNLGVLEEIKPKMPQLAEAANAGIDAACSGVEPTARSDEQPPLQPYTRATDVPLSAAGTGDYDPFRPMPDHSVPQTKIRAKNR